MTSCAIPSCHCACHHGRSPILEHLTVVTAIARLRNHAYRLKLPLLPKGADVLQIDASFLRLGSSVVPKHLARKWGSLPVAIFSRRGDLGRYKRLPKNAWELVIPMAEMSHHPSQIPIVYEAHYLYVTTACEIRLAVRAVVPNPAVVPLRSSPASAGVRLG